MISCISHIILFYPFLVTISCKSHHSDEEGASPGSFAAAEGNWKEVGCLCSLRVCCKAATGLWPKLRPAVRTGHDHMTPALALPMRE